MVQFLMILILYKRKVRINMKKQVIDLEKWDRAEPFYVFKMFEVPYTNLCSDIDITNFMRFIRTNDYHFYASFLFYVLKTVNIIKEFRCRLEEDVPVIWDQVDGNYTMMQETGILGVGYAEFIDNFPVFYEAVTNDIDKNKKSGRMVNKILENDAIVHITSIPWTHITNFSQAMYKVSSATPYIGIGRRYGEGEKIKISLAVQAHHAFIDGFHLSQFYKLLELLLSSPEKYQDATVSYKELLKESKPFILSEKEKPIFTF